MANNNKQQAAPVVDEQTIMLRKYEPACIFCGSSDGVKQVHGRNVCANCIAEMKALYPKAIITVLDKKTNQPYTIEDASGKPREIGHWVNGDTYNYDVMATCLAALQLMVYYRYLPTTQLKATEVEADVESLSKDKTGEINVSIDI